MQKISTPILGETTIEELIPKLKELGKTAQLIKAHYPSVWGSISNQYKLTTFPNVISDKLFERKLEILLLQDEELRKQ